MGEMGRAHAGSCSVLVARAAAARQLGLSDREPSWTGCTCVTTCPGRRWTARWRAAPCVARAVALDAYGRAPEGKRLAALAAAAERAEPGPMREGAGERAVRGAGDGRPAVACR